MIKNRLYILVADIAATLSFKLAPMLSEPFARCRSRSCASEATLFWSNIVFQFLLWSNIVFQLATCATAAGAGVPAAHGSKHLKELAKQQHCSPAKEPQGQQTSSFFSKRRHNRKYAIHEQQAYFNGLKLSCWQFVF